ncbi:MAG: CBS domain-containing protein [Brevibacterium sp.]|uniref:magnesium transporter MgtE N-terminal domain-containing protein n=1 Tax=Brevibacterium sp. TaxID=1701 RepID=UPI0026477518|nr:CBS domain-containing protein [Brevibacterium sp.]MDN5807422.1 CBS domain-containing protein [Brevibacterium sp.]MDN5834814.1 CBS domain-containing protein [Brevibacterium sp.]MDN5877247.1 CBS domain-containing protein [Brevibacterium sp.]MDN5909659.1 CBS domain-containing protein [Brevibacterium sp.]MDN6158527.1 CBS domain-containing protein [Brevibacterium sp.]
MSGPPKRVFVARLIAVPVFDPLGDQVGRVRDAVIVYRATMRQFPRVIGLVVEVPGRRRVFVPMGRVTSIDSGQVITTGLVNMRRFQQRRSETLVINDLLDRRLRLRDDDSPIQIEDVGIEQQVNKDWEVTRLFVRRVQERSAFSAFRRRGETMQISWTDTEHPADSDVDQEATQLIAAYQDTKPADLADVLFEMKPERRLQVARALDDERLADVIEELPDETQVELLSALDTQRAVTVLEEMEPDDAADLLGALSDEQAERFLTLMEPDDAEDVRTLLSYDDDTAGGLMTTEPVILTPETSVAEALAQVRREDLPAALAAAVFVCRQPIETPTGKYLGIVHIQEMLRHPPHEAVGIMLDTEVEPLPPESPLGEVTKLLAAYNLVSVPITDENDHLIGVVTVDDVLDELLPDDWRVTGRDDHRRG